MRNMKEAKRVIAQLTALAESLLCECQERGTHGEMVKGAKKIIAEGQDFMKAKKSGFECHKTGCRFTGHSKADIARHRDIFQHYQEEI
jgi:hypothetical protein